MSINAQKYTCTVCHQPFVIQESTRNNQTDTQHSACLEMIAGKRGSGRDEGQSHIQHGPCSRCGSETEYFSLPDGSHTIQCPECSQAYSSSSY